MKTSEVHTVEIPIIIRDDKVEFFYGGPLLPLKDGRMAENIKKVESREKTRIKTEQKKLANASARTEK